MVKTAFAGSSMCFWPVDLAITFISSLCYGERSVVVHACVRQVDKFCLASTYPLPANITSTPQRFISND